MCSIVKKNRKISIDVKGSENDTRMDETIKIEKPNFEEGEDHVLRAALFLEQLGRRFQYEFPPFWQIQKFLAKEKLQFKTETDVYFEGAICNTLLKILNLKRADLIYAFIKYKLSKSSNQFKIADLNEIFVIVNRFGNASPKKRTDYKDLLYKRLAEKLHLLKKTYGFNEKDIFEWGLGLMFLVSIYDHYQAVKQC